MEAAAYGGMAAAEGRHWWFAARRRIIARMLRRLDLPADARILEIGCGSGGNLEMLRAFGHLEAIEFDDAARAVARERSDIAIGRGALPDGLPEFAAPFDLVVMLDVLEHVERDEQSLGRLIGLLKPGGHLMLTVPAFRFLWSAHDTFHHHYRRYRRGPLRRMLEQAGFDLDYAGYFNTFLFPLVAGARLLDRVMGGGDPQAGLKVPAAPLNAVLREIFALERLIVPVLPLPFGVSLLIIACKPDRPAATSGSSGASR